MLKLKKLNYSALSVAILSSFLSYSAQAAGEYDEFTFDANSANYPTVSETNSSNQYATNNASSVYETNTTPSSSIGKLPVPTNVIQRATFEDVVKTKTGLTPDMIRELKKTYEEKNKAKKESSYDIPPARSRTISVSLGVTGQKEVIRTAYGLGTNIVVVDSTGKPWNVVNTNLGNGKVFDLQRLDGPEGYLFSLTPNKNSVRSNLTFVLKEGKSSNVKIPIVLDLVSGQREADDKIVLRIQGVGPNGSIEQTKLSQGIDSKYIAWLDGVIPSGVKKLKSDNKFVKAWKEKDGSIVVISKYQVISPLPMVMLDSSDGEATIYKLSSKSSNLLLKDPATKEIIKSKITGF